MLADSGEATLTLVTGSTSYVVGTAPREFIPRTHGILDEAGPALHENQYPPRRELRSPFPPQLLFSPFEQL